MNFCLIEKYAEKFKQALKSGEINPDKLVAMSSEERKTYLATIIGEFNAREANKLFEAKLLLKNQQQGLITWARNLAGLSEKSKTDIIDKIQKLDRALNPETEKQFLSDIVEQRLGTVITPEEGKTISDLANKAKGLFDSSKPNWEQPKEYWQTKQKLLSYIREITPESNPQTVGGKIMKGIDTGLSVQRAVKTGFDFSAPLRQGRALFGTKEWTQAFKNMFSYAKSQSALDNLEVDMMSNRYSEYALKNKRTLGLTMLGEKFTQREEQFGSKLIDKIPLLKGSGRAYVGFLNDIRFNRFVNIMDNLEKAGKGITDNPQAQKDLAEVIAASTGRGTLGSFEQAAKPFATVLFSPRWIASRIEMITNPVLKSGPARMEATKSLARLAGTSLGLLYLAKMAGAKVETDINSSDFGKMTVGKTRFDFTGGLAPYIVLLSKEISGKSKSSTTGRITKLNSGKFGSQTRLDALVSFFESKTSPMASIARDVLKGQQFGGQKMPPIVSKDFAEYLATQLGEPLLASDAIQAFQEGAGVGIGATAGSLFGVGVNTYK